MIQLDKLRFKYHKEQTNVIDIPHLEVNESDIIFLVGKSGSGKSTLINLLAGMLKPNCGTIQIDGTCINHLKAKQINNYRANYIGLISQQFNLIPVSYTHLTLPTNREV